MTDPTGRYEFLPSPDSQNELWVFLCEDGSHIGTMKRKRDGKWMLSLPFGDGDGMRRFSADIHSLDGAAKQLIQAYERQRLTR